MTSPEITLLPTEYQPELPEYRTPAHWWRDVATTDGTIIGDIVYANQSPYPDRYFTAGWNVSVTRNSRGKVRRNLSDGRRTGLRSFTTSVRVFLALLAELDRSEP